MATSSGSSVAGSLATASVSGALNTTGAGCGRKPDGAMFFSTARSQEPSAIMVRMAAVIRPCNRVSPFFTPTP